MTDVTAADREWVNRIVGFVSSADRHRVENIVLQALAAVRADHACDFAVEGETHDVTQGTVCMACWKETRARVTALEGALQRLVAVCDAIGFEGPTLDLARQALAPGAGGTA